MSRAIRRDRPTSRRRALVLFGGVAATLAGCGGREEEPIEYTERRTVGDLPTRSGNGSNASAAAAAAARAERDGDNYAVGIDALVLREHDLVVYDDYRGVVIEGTVANTGERRIERAEVRVRAYDEGGDQLDRYLDSTTDLDAGTTWRFAVVVLERPADVASYDIAVAGSWG